MSEYIVLLRGGKDDDVIKVVAHVSAVTSFMALLGSINEYHVKYPDYMITNVKMFET